MLEAILVGIIDAVLLRKTMQFCSGVDSASRVSSAASENEVRRSVKSAIFWVFLTGR